MIITADLSYSQAVIVRDELRKQRKRHTVTAAGVSHTTAGKRAADRHNAAALAFQITAEALAETIATRRQELIAQFGRVPRGS
jgi:hypothetical protein